MNEYELLGKLHNIIDENINEKIYKWLDDHNVNYYLLYPLAAVELGARLNPPQSMDNLFKRCIAAYIFSKAKEHGKEFYLRKFNTPGFKKYLKLYEKELVPLYQNYRFSKEINDINPFSKPRLTQEDEKRYILTTSLVSNVYSEENFYFYGVDEPEDTNKEKIQVENLHRKFWNKIFLEKKGFKEIQDNVDRELYKACIEIVEKDLNKWNSNVRSEVFDNPGQLAKVIAYFYYHAMIKSIMICIDMQYEKDYFNIGKDCIMILEKDFCIRTISNISGIPIQKVSNIVEYFINDGRMNLLEFPLLEVENKIITIPSTIMVNDWQFTVVNGHYIKGISIRNRERTISTITEGRIERTLQDVENVAVAKTKTYSFVDEAGETQCSDIDYAIYDMSRNILLIIEAKWIDKHYKDEMDKRYGMILQSLNKIYTKQIEKHKKYLENDDNIDNLFEGDSRYHKVAERPQIFYLAVDKRNQLHINERHMISEYMLIYFLKKHIKNRQLDLWEMWKEIEPLQTKVEYITVSDEYYEIPVDDEIMLVEQNDLYWDEKVLRTINR